MDDKVIRISAGVDEGSFRGLVSNVQAATREVEKLGEAISHLSRGGASPISVTGGAGAQGDPGKGFAGAQATMRASGLGQTLTQGLADVGPAMSRAASDARTASRTMGDSLRDVASAAEPQVRRLQSAVEGLANAMRQMRAMGQSSGGQQQGFLPGMGPSPSYAASGDQVQMGLRGLPDRSGRTQMGLGPYQVAGTGPSSIPAHLGTPLPFGEMSDEELSAVSPGRGFMRRMKGVGQTPIGLPQAVTDMIPAGMRGAFMRYGPMLGAGYAAYKTYDFMTQAMATSNVANAEEKLQHQEWYGADLRAAGGQTFGNAGVSILGGDLGTARAWRQTLRDPSTRRLLGLEMTQRREQLNAHAQGLPMFTEALTGERMGSTSAFTVGNVKSFIGNQKDKLITEFSNVMGEGLLQGIGKVRSKFDKVVEAGEGLVLSPEGAASRRVERDAATARLLTRGGDEETLTRQEIGMRRGNAAIPLQQMEELRKRADSYRAADPMFNYISGGLMGGAMGTMNMLRAGGMGQREVRDKEYGNVQGYSGDLWAAGIRARGFEESQAIALRGAVQGSAGRGLMGYGDSLLGMQAGGLHNVASIFGVGAQLGGYKGGGLPPLLQAVQRSIGTGGLDVTAGAGLAEQVGGLLRQGHAGLGGAEAFEQIAGAAYTPALPGENRAARDVRAAQAMGEGMQYEAQRMGGGIDPLGQALTRRAALTVAGARGPEVANALERLMRNPAEFTQIMASGRIPRGLAALGIREGDLKALQQEQTLQNTVRIVQHGLPTGTVAGDFAERVIKSGKGGIAGAVRGLLDEKLGTGFSDRLQALRRKAPGSAQLKRLERQAMDVYRPGLEGFSEIVASASGDQQSPEAIASDLELQMTREGFGRPVRGAGAHDTIGKNALERVAATAQGKLKAKESQEKYNQSAKFGEAAANPDLQVTAMGAANEKVQGAAGAATNLQATTQALDVAVNKVALSLSNLASRINSAVPTR